jgi:hypothetical protein
MTVLGAGPFAAGTALWYCENDSSKKIKDERRPNQQTVDLMKLSCVQFFPDHAIALDDGTVKFKHLRSVVDKESRISRNIHEFDSVSVSYGNGIEYAFVSSIWSITAGNVEILLFFPLWYKKDENVVVNDMSRKRRARKQASRNKGKGNGEEDESDEEISSYDEEEKYVVRQIGKHIPTDTQLVRKYNEVNNADVYPLPVSTIGEQVMVVHNCRRTLRDA